MAIKAVIFDMYETLITQYRSEVYFTGNIAKDAGIAENEFRKYWSMTEDERTLGRLSLRDVTGDIMKHFNCYSENVLDDIYVRRVKAKSKQFMHLHKEIIPMLDSLKNRKIKIGLVSNCYLEEAEVIEMSNLYRYMDVSVLSSREGLMKPDRKIFELCVQRLGVVTGECLYVGDGGSNELYAARGIGMKPIQACWYLKEWDSNYRQTEFEGIDSPLKILEYV